MSFLQEPVPPRGVLLPVLPHIGRVVADNPSVMTYHGTNSWIIEAGSEVMLIDPGPEDDAHLQALLAAIQGRTLKYILLTHTHLDHFGNARALQSATGAPIVAYKHPARKNFTPDLPLEDGDIIGGLKAIYTPGHASDHLCFYVQDKMQQKLLFSGDHVMSWSSSIVNPPDGDMRAYYASLRLLLSRDDDVYLCGHGPLLTNPRALTAELLSHREFREQTIVDELHKQDFTVAALAAGLYHKSDLYLKAAAQRNVLAHLLKLTAEGVVEEHQPETQPHPDIVAIMEANKTKDDPVTQRLYRDSLRKFGLCGTGRG